MLTLEQLTPSTQKEHQIAAAKIALAYTKQKGLKTMDLRSFEYQAQVDNMRCGVLKLDSLLLSTNLDGLEKDVEALQGVFRVAQQLDFTATLLRG